MLEIPLYTLRFAPILRRLIWGGRRLGTLLHKPIGEESDYAESWEICDYRDAVSIVSDGPLAGVSLRDLVQRRAGDLMGPGLANRDQFPLLVKFIDAHDVLSVQVHPDDEKAKRLAGDNGKTETWVIVDAEPGSLIYAGLKSGVTREQLREAVARGRVEPLLHRFEPKPGDCIMIEAGTVHAIGAGVLLAEIQQMSDATFRIDDWGRTGPDGKPRELHIEQAMESIDFNRGPVNPLAPVTEPTAEGNLREQLSKCPYFALERWTLKQPRSLGLPDRFTIVMGLGGSCLLRGQGRETSLAFGETLLQPASAGPCEVVPDRRHPATVLTCHVP
jgi:mannose-6-phosphate isomerase